MWTTENRARYDRNYLRYPSDLTDAEWALIEPGLPPAKRGAWRSSERLVRPECNVRLSRLVSSLVLRSSRN